MFATEDNNTSKENFTENVPNLLFQQISTKNLVSNGQARYIPLEIKLRNEDLPRYNKKITNPSELKNLQLRHKKGSIAMARSNKLNSASAQFYFALKSLPELDGRYSIFGKVINGMETLEKIEKGDLIFKAKFKTEKSN